MRRIVLVTALLAAAPLGAQNAAEPSTGDFGQSVHLSSLTGPTLQDFQRGQRALAEGRYAKAQRLLAPLADGPTFRGADLLAAYADLGAGDPAKAQRRFAGLVERSRSNALARHGLGLAFVAQGRVVEAKGQLAELERQRERCAGTCARSAELERATASLRRLTR